MGTLVRVTTTRDEFSRT